MSNVIFTAHCTWSAEGPFGFLSVSSSTVNPINPSSVNTQNCAVLFVAKNKSVKTFDGFDLQYTAEEYLHQNDVHMIFTMGEQPIDPVAYNPRHKQK